MKYLISIIMFPLILLAQEIKEDNSEIILKLIYAHAKSEKSKCEILLTHRYSHDITLIIHGKKDAYNEIMEYISKYNVD